MKLYLLGISLLMIFFEGINAMQPANPAVEERVSFILIPADLRKQIVTVVATAPNNGKFDHEKGLDYSENLTNTIKGVKNTMIAHRAYTYSADEYFIRDLVQLLFKRFAFVKKPLIAAKLNTTGAGKWIKSYLQTPYGLSDTINTFIHVAEFGSAQDLGFMIQYIPELVNAINPASSDSQTEDVTPLMAAARHANLRAVQQLLKVPGINVHKKNSKNYEALWFAERSKSAQKDAVIKLLQAYGQ